MRCWTHGILWAAGLRRSRRPCWPRPARSSFSFSTRCVCHGGVLVFGVVVLVFVFVESLLRLLLSSSFLSPPSRTSLCRNRPVFPARRRWTSCRRKWWLSGSSISGARSPRLPSRPPHKRTPPPSSRGRYSQSTSVSPLLHASRFFFVVSEGTLMLASFFALPFRHVGGGWAEFCARRAEISDVALAHGL